MRFRSKPRGPAGPPGDVTARRISGIAGGKGGEEGGDGSRGRAELQPVRIATGRLSGHAALGGSRRLVAVRFGTWIAGRLTTHCGSPRRAQGRAVGECHCGGSVGNT